jgi:hypothetical protein
MSVAATFLTLAGIVLYVAAPLIVINERSTATAELVAVGLFATGSIFFCAAAIVHKLSGVQERLQSLLPPERAKRIEALKGPNSRPGDCLHCKHIVEGVQMNRCGLLDAGISATLTDPNPCLGEKFEPADVES